MQVQVYWMEGKKINSSVGVWNHLQFIQAREMKYSHITQCKHADSTLFHEYCIILLGAVFNPSSYIRKRVY